MGRCSYCRHWRNPVPEQPENGWNVPLGMRVCDGAPLFAYERFAGQLTEHINLPVATPPDFGCTRFEATEGSA